MPSIAGRVLRASCWETSGPPLSTSFSALHRGQGPAGTITVNEVVTDAGKGFQCPPSRAGSCGVNEYIEEMRDMG